MSVLIKGISLDEFADYDRDGIGYLIGTGQAVEVPTPHGPLIDTDALMSALQELFEKREEEARFVGRRGATVTWNDAVYHIKIAPTTIEAEEG